MTDVTLAATTLIGFWCGTLDPTPLESARFPLLDMSPDIYFGADCKLSLFLCFRRPCCIVYARTRPLIDTFTTIRYNAPSLLN